jgi:hypothetical protein
MRVRGSDPNRSTRRRCGPTIRYASTEVRSLDPTWNQNSILCRGADPSGDWANIPRPEAESLDNSQDPRLRKSPSEWSGTGSASVADRRLNFGP